MINCLIVDDENPSLELIKTFAQKIPSLNIIKATANPVEALVAIKNEDIQLIISDIQMEDVSGIDIAKAAKDKCKVIFITGYSEYALDGYRHEIIDYLLKPVQFPRFLEAVQRAEKIFTELPQPVQDKDNYLFVKMGVKGKLQKIEMDDIDYIEGNGNYITIYHKGKKTLVNSNLKDIEKKLPADKFIRVHKSYIIQLNRVEGIEGNKIILKEINRDIIFSETYKADFFNIIHNKTLE